MKPRIILGMPPVLGLVDLIDEALTHHGFDVINLSHISQNNSYPSLSARLYAHWRKLLGDKETAKTLKGQNIIHALSRQLNGQKADYALFISADIYSTALLDFVRQNSVNGSINYQFDGMHRFAAIKERMTHFDRFYAFDPADAQQYKVLFATNFYFDHLPPTTQPTQTRHVYFFGSHHDSRTTHIQALAQHMTQLGYTSDIHIVCKDTQCAAQYADYPIKIVKKPIDFRQNIIQAQCADILVDFVASDHAGLSFRTFESLAYRKKLITTNATVRHYDFYHPNNIFIWNGKNLNGLDEFLALPYHEIDPTTREKYSFGNWIKYVLNIAPYQPITLPK